MTDLDAAGPVLVVDDDEGICTAIQEFLEDEGRVVYTASNGREALDTLTRIPRPCLILLDLWMPIMDGAQVLQHLRADANAASIPVVIVTASQGIPVSGVPILYKPVRTDSLLQIVENYCSGRPHGAGESSKTRQAWSER
jgi:CheY-like chemotaxis protein